MANPIYDWQGVFSQLLGGNASASAENVTPSVAGPPGFGLPAQPKPVNNGPTNWLDWARANVPKDKNGNIISAGGGSISGTSTTNPTTFQSFTSWFNPARIVTVLLGLILFGAGVFLLGKSEAIGAINGAVKDAVR